MTIVRLDHSRLCPSTRDEGVYFVHSRLNADVLVFNNQVSVWIIGKGGKELQRDQYVL